MTKQCKICGGSVLAGGVCNFCFSEIVIYTSLVADECDLDYEIKDLERKAIEEQRNIDLCNIRLNEGLPPIEQKRIKELKRRHYENQNLAFERIAQKRIAKQL